MMGAQSPMATERVSAFNRRNMFVNALLAGALALAGFWVSQEATGARYFLSLVASSMMALLCLTALGLLMFSSKFVVVIDDLGIHDKTRPWRKRSLRWGDVDAVSVDGFPGVGQVVTIRSKDPKVKPLHISSRHVQSVPDGLLAAIREQPKFVGQIR